MPTSTVATLLSKQSVCRAFITSINMAAFFNVRSEKVYKERRTPGNNNFKMLYRFEKDNVEWLSEYFMGYQSERRGGATSAEEKMRIFLRYVGDPGFQVGVGEDTGMHQSTVCRTLHYVAKHIVDKSSLWIKFPSDYPQQLEAKQDWLLKYSFPSCIGALDCTHVEIKKPHLHSEEYINRKGYASINIQATCNAREWFTSVVCEWPGSVHDSRIWKNSFLEPILKFSENTILLADEGYGIAPWLMTPFKNPTSNIEKAYNKLHTKERVIIERCFGQLKSWFPILQNCIRVELKNVPTLVTACFVLHNIAKYLNDSDDFEISEGEGRGNESAVHTSENNASVLQIRRLGQMKRNELAEMIYNTQL